MDDEVVAATSQLKYQDYLLRNYQELMHDKNMLRKEMLTEMDAMRSDRLDARKAMLETRNAREQLELDKKKAMMERRAREIESTKSEMAGIVKNYLDYKSRLE